MYKVKTKKEYATILILLMFLILVTMLLRISSQHPEVLTEKSKFFPILSIFIIIVDILGIIYEINLIQKYKWLAKNGLLIKNVPFTAETDVMYTTGGPQHNTTISVEYKLETGEKVILSRNWRGKRDFRKNRRIDILIDKNNPQKRYYIDFNIKKQLIIT